MKNTPAEHCPIWLQISTLWIVLASLAAHALALPSPRQDWIEVRTQNFTLSSAVSEKATLRIAEDLEKLRSVLGTATALELRSSVPTHIYVFKNDRAFTPYKPLFNGRPIELGGLYLDRTQANYILINNSANVSPRELIYHEYTHYVLNNTLEFIPTWLNEGMAEYYSTFETSGDKASIGKIVDRHVLWLRGK